MARSEHRGRDDAAAEMLTRGRIPGMMKEKWWAGAVDRRWLVDMFLSAGLGPEHAARAAELAFAHFARHRPAAGGALPPKKLGLTAYLGGDPRASVERLLAVEDDGLPFVAEGRLGLVAFGNLLREAGCDPVVALAFAKVIVEAFEPSAIYQPIWQALGRSGAVDLRALAGMDWSSARLEATPVAQQAHKARDVEVTRTVQASLVQSDKKTRS